MVQIVLKVSPLKPKIVPTHWILKKVIFKAISDSMEIDFVPCNQEIKSSKTTFFQNLVVTCRLNQFDKTYVPISHASFPRIKGYQMSTS